MHIYVDSFVPKIPEDKPVKKNNLPKADLHLQRHIGSTTG